MPKLSEKGVIAQVLILLLLVTGILGGLYLVKNPQIFKPKAANTGTRIEFFGTGVSADKLTTTSQTVNINAYYVAPSPSPTASSSAVPSTPTPSVQPSPQGPTIILNTQAPIIAGQIISVSWSGVSSPTVNDVLVVSRVGASLTRGMIFTSSCTTTPGTVAKASGTCSNFQLSTSNISDNFKLDLLQNGATNIASSAPFYLWATGSTPTPIQSGLTSSPTPVPSAISNPSPVGVGGSVKGVAYAQTAVYPDSVKLSHTQAGLAQPCPNDGVCTFAYSGNPTVINNWRLSDGAGSKTVYAQFLSNNQPLGAIVSAGINFTQPPSPTPSPSLSPISDPSRGIPGDLIADIVLGHPDFNQAVPGEVVPFKVMNPGGVVVDRNASPNRIYVYDGANSRVLGYKSLGTCSNNPSTTCTNQKDCNGASCNVSARKDADIIIGQAKGDYSGCNDDGNMVSYPNRAPASASKLCTTVPTQNSPREGGSSSNMFVDSAGSLYITDFHNNRVLKYIDPFKTDTIADEVWGQDDFTGFRCNKADGDIASASIPNPAASTLCMGRNTKYQESFDAGVTLDHFGNMWVSDSSNHRVLRFPKQTNGIAKTADLVLGQTNFTTRSDGSGLNKLKKPSGIREGSDGRIFVADTGNNRVMVFAPPFTNGQSGTTFGSQFKSPSGLEFSPDDDGLWVADVGNKMLELWSLDGSEVKKVLSKDTYQPNGNCGSTTQNTVCINPQPDGGCYANLCEVYGSVGIDNAGNVYATASDGFQDMVRYPAPIPAPQPGKLLSSDKRFFSPPGGSNYLSEKGLSDPQGITTSGNQLIVSDGKRILFWNGYKNLSSGKAADGFVGIDSINSFQSVDPWGTGRIRVDNQNRLWVMRKSTIDVYQLPLVSGAHPIKQAAISFEKPLPVLGSSQKLTWKFEESLSGLDFDKAGNLWLAQGIPGTYKAGNLGIAQGNPGIHRVFRIRDPFNKPTVDVILGQASPAETSCNRILALDDHDAQANPYGAAPNTLCKPGAVRIDAVGNVWVSDYSLEYHGNRRMLEFNASQFANISNTALMGPNADLVSPAVRAWEASFDSANHMALGYDGQLGLSFPGLYTNPLQSLKTSAAPNLTLKDFFSHGFSSTFDSDDNLYITDLNRGRVLIYKKPFGTVTPTPSPILTPTPVVVPCPAGALCVTLTPPAKSPHKSASGQVVIQDNKPSQKGLTQLKINGSVKGLDPKTSYRVYVCKAQDSCSSSGLMIFTTDSSGNGTIQKDAVVSSWTDPVSAFISVKIAGGKCNTPSNACLSAPVSFSTVPPPSSQPVLPPVIMVPDCRADVNRDGYVNIKDVSLVIGCLGRKTSQNNIVGLSCANADVNLDKSIDLKDISFVISKFGKKVDPGQCSIPGTSPIISGPINKKAILVIYDPILANGKKLNESAKWNDPRSLTNQVVESIKRASGGYVNYKIVETVERNEWPRKIDGFRYTEETFNACRADSSKCHRPDDFDYNQMWTDLNLCQKISSGQVDDVFVYGFGYSGVDEYALKIPGDKMPYNTPTNPWFYQLRKKNIPDCNGKTVWVMGWISEVGVDNAFHSYGHRAENALGLTVGRGFWDGCEGTSDFDKFTCAKLDIKSNSKLRVAGCGNVHTPYNGAGGYDYGNATLVDNICSSFKNYSLSSPAITKDSCTPWNCGGQLSYLEYWFGQFPKLEGKTVNGDLKNWWKYVADFDNAVAEAKGTSVSPAPTTAPSSPPITSLPDCRADVGRNGFVNGQDISQTVGCQGLVIGQKNASGLPCANADVNQDGLIDQKDIQFISSKYGKKVDLKQCPNIPVPAVNSFLNLKSSATTATASFNFSYTGTAANYQVNMSTKSDMSWDVYLSFGGNKNSPVTVQNPSVKWDKYKCGAILYWQVLDSAKNIKSPIQQVIVTCPDAQAKRVFVTSTAYNGNLGGLAGADAKCQAQANSAKLGGSWKAWLSDSKTSAKSRLNNYFGPFKLVNGVTVANNWRDLTDGSIQAAVNINELKKGRNGWPWTGTNYDGNNSAWTNTSQYCNNWTSSAWWWGSGVAGLTDTTGTKWSLNTSTSRCNTQSPLFCFEQ